MKKTLVLAVMLILIISLGNIVLAEDSIRNYEKAEKLNALGILKGSDKGFELERELSRVEGSVMLVRLLGKEQAAKEQKNWHPFSDVPNWANDYVGYLFQNGLTNGTSETTFGSADKMTSAQYITFILRAIGYDDKKGDFKWNESIEKAEAIGLINQEEKNILKTKTAFLRDDMVGLSFNALRTKLKDSEITLTEKLIKEKVFSEETGEKEGVYKGISIEEKISKLIEFDKGVVIFQDPNWDDSLTTYIIREELPVELQNFSKITVTGFPKENSINDILNIYIERKGTSGYTGEKYNSAGFGSSAVDLQNNSYLVLLFDNEDNLLGYHYVDKKEINSKKECFKNIELTLEEKYKGKLRALDFNIIRKINGKVDEEFEWTGGRTSSKLEEGYTTKVVFEYLFYLDGYEYEITPLDNSIKIKKQTVKSCEW